MTELVEKLELLNRKKIPNRKRSPSLVALVDKLLPSPTRDNFPNQLSDDFFIGDDAIYLPSEIFELFLGQLIFTDLRAAACVCRCWNKASYQPKLGWAEVLPFGVWRLKPENHPMRPVNGFRSLDSIKGVVRSSLQIIDSEYYRIRVDVVGKTIPPKCTEELPKMFVTPNLWSVKIVPGNQRREEGEKYRWDLQVKVNVPLFEKLSLAGEATPGKALLLHLLRFRAASLLSILPSTGPRRSLLNAHIQQPDGLTIQLHNYQLAALQWMKSIEERPHEWIDYLPIYPAHQIRSRLLVDLDNERFIAADRIRPNDIHRFRWRGGILADEMGLGKTMTIAGLILSKSFAPTAKDDLKANLVICPSHLVKQWADELREKTPGLKVYPISTIVDHRKFTILNLRQADIVIVSANLFKGASYKTIRSRYRENAKTGPIFQNYRWFRLIIDEGHELLRDEKFVSSILDDAKIDAQFRWYISGSPFPSTDVYDGLFKFLEFESDPSLEDDYSPSNLYSKSLFIEHLIKNRYWRNTKASISKESSIPDYTEDLQLIELHPIERALYEEAIIFGERDRQLSICSHPQIDLRNRNLFGEESICLEEIRTTQIRHHREKLAELKYRVQRYLGFINSNPIIPGSPPDLVRRVGEFQRVIEKCKVKIALIESALALFKSLNPEKRIVSRVTETKKPETGSESLPLPIPKMTVKQLQNALNKRQALIEGKKA